LHLELFFVDSHKFFPSARIFSKTIVRDPIKPRGKARFTAKTAYVFISAQEGLLRQVVGKSDVGSSKLTEQTAHGGLMPPNELTESVLVVIDKNSCEEICISQLHGRRLRYRRRVVFLCIQLPYKQIANSNQKRNQPQGPRTALPIACRAEKRDHTEANH
jgi:Rad3-related DNA helicase